MSNYSTFDTNNPKVANSRGRLQMSLVGCKLKKQVAIQGLNVYAFFQLLHELEFFSSYISNKENRPLVQYGVYFFLHFFNFCTS